MSWDEVKNEKEGYVKVRKSEDRALVGRLRKANDDPEAKGYIELNKDDLGGMGGGGGPHSHSEYASKTHAHDDKADKDHTHDLTHTHSEYADKTTTNQILNAMATDISSLETKTYNNQEAIKTKADADHTHDDLGGGASYDDTEISGRVSATESKNTQQDQRLGSLEVKASIAADDITDLYALSEKKAAVDHTHDAPDLTHEHEGMVTSASVTSIVRLSQAEFDALVDKDASTLYLVV